jgi:ribosome-binding protein aMBF1 (putative translation factor)
MAHRASKKASLTPTPSEAPRRKAQDDWKRVHPARRQQIRERDRQRRRVKYRAAPWDAPVEEGIRKRGNRYYILWREPHPETGFSTLRSHPYPLDTPRETMRSDRDAKNREAANKWAPILAERKRLAAERRDQKRQDRQRRREERQRLAAERRQDRDTRRRVARNIYQYRDGRWRVYWAAPDPVTKRARTPTPSKRLPADRTLQQCEQYRDAREREAKDAWARNREEKQRQALTRRPYEIIEPGIYKYPRHYWVAWPAPDPETGYSKTGGGSFPLDTPREDMRALRDAKKREAAQVRAPILAQRQRAAEERREQGKQRRAQKMRKRNNFERVARNIRRNPDGRWRVEWSAPDPVTKRAYHPSPKAYFSADHTIEFCTAFRDAREQEASVAWTQIGDERREDSRQRAAARRREIYASRTYDPIAKGIRRVARKSDGQPLFCRVAIEVRDPETGKRRSSQRRLPVTMTDEELVRRRNAIQRQGPKKAASLGDVLEQHRRLAGWTIEELAERVLIEKAACHAHRKNRAIPRPRVLRRYAEVFGIELADLLALVEFGAKSREESPNDPKTILPARGR